ncbi:MAG: hypothetical protein WC989_01995 [Micavibrio sp.]
MRIWLVAVMIANIVSLPAYADSLENRAKIAVKSILKDPESARFGQISRCKKGFVLGEVNAKNSFGGYTGNQLFVSNGGKYTYIFNPDPEHFDNIVPRAIVRSNCDPEDQ